MGFKRTDEQVEGIDSIKAGYQTKLSAYAGCTKTTTLLYTAEDLAVEDPKVKLNLFAYNASIAREAKEKFPKSNTRAGTMHSFAMGPMGKKYAKRILDDNARKSYGKEIARILGIKGPLEIGVQQFLSPGAQGRLINEGLARFCYSADMEISGYHIPAVPAADMSIVRHALEPYLKAAWWDVTRTDEDGRGKIGIKKFHDIYLKLWQLSKPRIHGDIGMLDEAQDTNDCVNDIFMSQEHMQLVVVGDSNQQLYGWRGAVDAMAKFPAQKEVLLSQSFRFGPAIAAEGTKWLKLLGNEKPMRGWDQIEDRIDTTLLDTQATLCRTNAGVLAAALASMDRGKSVAVVGGVYDIKQFAEAARDLQANSRTDHPELAAFKNWSEVRQFVEEEAGELKVMVNAIDTYGVEEVLRFCATAKYKEKDADAIFSTAHKAKGREWESVTIGNDFPDPADKEDAEEGAEPNRAEMMLAYVAVTRAKKVLNNSGLSWVDNYIDVPKKETV